jgi:hypothetical protein
VGDKVLHLHHFAGACDWLDLPELEQVNVGGGLLIVERDLRWTPAPATDAHLPGRNAT